MFYLCFKFPSLAVWEGGRKTFKGAYRCFFALHLISSLSILRIEHFALDIHKSISFWLYFQYSNCICYFVLEWYYCVSLFHRQLNIQTGIFNVCNLMRPYMYSYVFMSLFQFRIRFFVLIGKKYFYEILCMALSSIQLLLCQVKSIQFNFGLILFLLLVFHGVWILNL